MRLVSPTSTTEQQTVHSPVAKDIGYRLYTFIHSATLNLRHRLGEVIYQEEAKLAASTLVTISDMRSDEKNEGFNGGSSRALQH